MATPPEASGTIVPVKTDGVDGDDVELSEKLEANRDLEADNKSVTVIDTTPVLSRKASVSSITSPASSNSRDSDQAGGEEDVGSGNSRDIGDQHVNDCESAKRKRVSSIKKERDYEEYYVEYLKEKSPSEKLTRSYTARTFPDHDFFKENDGLNQESLFNVMEAYSLHDKKVGYCQESRFIVGLLLMKMPEKEAFAVFVKLMREFRLRELFTPSMEGLDFCMYQLECMIQELFPKLFKHFQDKRLYTSMYASRWFRTLFATFSLKVACRVMDDFRKKGMEIIFRVALAILQTSREKLMSLDKKGMLKFLQKKVPKKFKFEAEIDKLLQNAYTIKLNTKKLKMVPIIGKKSEGGWACVSMPLLATLPLKATLSS